MREVKACAIITNDKGELLLQLRDEEPQAGTWVLFGGGTKEGETEEQALRRELGEELEYMAGNLRFWGRYEDNGVEQAVYIVEGPVRIEQLVLHEGSDMKFFGVAELQTLEIGFNFKDIINDFLNRKNMENQNLANIEKLDHYATRAARELSQWKYPEITIEKSSRNVFVGAGDADNTGRILAQNFGGCGFSVVDYKRFFENDPEKDHNVYIVNASGAKDGIKMAQWLTEKGYRPKLITSNPEPPAGKFLKPEDIFVFPAIIEPPTYNVSTYAAMLYGILGEDISGLPDKLEYLKVPDLRRYKFIFFLTDDKYEIIGRMAKRKVAETLAGLGADAGGYSNAAHGMLLQPNPDRLVVALNCEYDGPGDVYELEGNSYVALILSLHYIIGKNQTDSDSETILKNYFENAKKQGWEFNKVW
jgi:8-oxo-dGTP pyrophosphatase MutT (NUDIX family)